jgi:hypothetical protein
VEREVSEAYRLRSEHDKDSLLNRDVPCGEGVGVGPTGAGLTKTQTSFEASQLGGSASIDPVYLAQCC